MNKSCRRHDISNKLWSKLEPLIIRTSRTPGDCKKAIELIENISANGLIADRGYDTNTILESALNLGMQVVIPPKQNRIIKREYDKQIY